MTVADNIPRLITSVLQNNSFFRLAWRWRRWRGRGVEPKAAWGRGRGVEGKSAAARCIIILISREFTSKQRSPEFSAVIGPNSQIQFADRTKQRAVKRAGWKEEKFAYGLDRPPLSRLFPLLNNARVRSSFAFNNEQFQRQHFARCRLGWFLFIEYTNCLMIHTYSSIDSSFRL